MPKGNRLYFKVIINALITLIIKWYDIKMWLTQPMSLQYIPTPAMQNNELSLIELDCLLTGLNMAELASLKFLPSHPLVIITVKDRKSVSFLKLEPLFTVA